MTSSERPSTSGEMIDSRYGRLWVMTACLAAATSIAVAVTQSPLVPLSLLVLSLSPCGGKLAVQAPPRTTFTRRRFLYGRCAPLLRCSWRSASGTISSRGS